MADLPRYTVTLTPSPTPGKKSWMGSVKHTMDMVGDIRSPVIGSKDIGALRD